jgi:hypothetical protein
MCGSEHSKALGYYASAGKLNLLTQQPIDIRLVIRSRADPPKGAGRPGFEIAMGPPKQPSKEVSFQREWARPESERV